MKKTQLIIISIFAFASLSFAQSTFGVKGGLNFSNFATDKDQIDDANTKLGFTVGLYHQTYIIGEWLMLQPELLYTLKGAKYKYETTEVNAKLQYIDIPVSAVIQILKSPITFHAGPQLSFLTKAKYEYKSPLLGSSALVDDNKDNYKKWDLGGFFGIGIQGKSMLIEARVIRGLVNVEKDKTIVGQPITAKDSRNFAFQLSAGFEF